MNDANPPNIDQRLDRLTERHEALTQTVELIAAAQLKSDERLEKVTADIAKLAALMSQTDKFINRLAHIAEAHEQRLDRMEGQ
jgi:septal ring factor EnvC (AmiA/AmiB activator)